MLCTCFRTSGRCLRIRLCKPQPGDRYQMPGSGTWVVEKVRCLAVKVDGVTMSLSDFRYFACAARKVTDANGKVFYI